MISIRKAALITITINFCGCQSINNQKSKKEPDTTLSVPLSTSPTDIPITMWSPAQRKTTAAHHFMLAEQMALRSDFVAAEQFFESAYNIDPNPFIGVKMIQVGLSLGKREESERKARKLVLLHPESADAHFLYAQVLMSLGLNNKALVSLERTVELNKHHENAYIMLIFSYLQLGEDRKALAINKEMLTNLPGSTKGKVQITKLYIRLNQYKNALNTIKSAYIDQGSNPDVVLLYALSLDLNGKRQEAIKRYEQLYNLNPDNEELQNRMIQVYREMGSLDQALELLNEISGNSDSPSVAITLQKALILWEMNRIDEASDLLVRIADENKNSDRAQFMAGLGLEKMSRYEDAMKYYDRVSEESDFVKDATLRRAIILKELKKYDEAVVGLEKIVKNERYRTAAHYEILALIYSKKNKPKEAIKVLQGGSKVFQEDLRLLFLIGVYYEELDQQEKTIEVMEEILAKDSNYVGALNYLGYMFAERGENLDRAEKLLIKALSLKPGDGYYLDSLAWVYYKKKDFEKAKKYILLALKEKPTESVILEHMGDILVALGEKQEALTYFNKALKESLDEKDRKRISEKVTKYDKK